ncbi:MAG: sensor domain-containing diguanylate cyclase [Epsilonproteobacteria bacterium]|nr:MAG: sensor domain-containing diguanylate cyclase [Campylobacterota bacterium]
MSEKILNNLKLYQVPINALNINIAVYRKQDDDFIIIDFNEAALKTESLKKNAIIGKKLTEVFPSIKEFGLFKVLEHVNKNGGHETFDLKFYKDKRISGWRKNEIIKLPNGDIMAIYEDVTKEKQLQEQLKKLESFIDNSHTIVFFWKPQKCWPVEYVSDNISDWGYLKDDFLSGKINYEDIIYPDDLERIKQEVKEHTLKQNNSFVQVYRVVTADGSIRWIDDRTIIERDSDGMTTHYLGTIIDITEQKTMENQLYLLGKIIDKSINEIYIFSKNNFQYIYLNRGAEENMGYSLEEMRDMTPIDIHPEHTVHQFKKLLAPLVSGLKQEITIDTSHLRKDGTIYNVEAHIQLMKIDDKEQFVVIALDITKRKKIELNLIQSEEKFRTIAENSLMGIFIYKDNFVYANRAIEDMIGYSLKELYKMSPWELVEEAYKEPMKKTMLRRLSGKQFTQEYSDIKFVHKDGSIKIARIMTQTIKYENGYAGLGSIIDITDIKDTKQKLKMLAQALEQSDELIMITDSKGIITYVNDAYVAHTGYKHYELIGKSSSILKSGAHSKEFYEELWNTISSNKTYTNTIINKKKDKQLYYEEVAISPIYDDNGRIQNYISTGRDITPRIKMEEELRLRATTDDLTKIYNRYYGNEMLDIEVDRANRYGSGFAVLMFDIDHFKLVNDTYGHDVGDYVLKKLSKIISMHMRKSDTFIRWGGEEFLIISAHLDKNEAMKFAQKLRVAIESYEFNSDFGITISIGVTTSKVGDAKREILKRADDALYRAKEDGRNCVKFI